MSFNSEFIHGYTKYSNTFDLWCKKAYSIMGEINQCGITEFDKNGYALIATNRPDFGESYIDKKGYLLDTNWVYSDNLTTGFKTQCSNEGLQFLQNNEIKIFGKKFDVWYGFSYLEKTSSSSYRLCFFASDQPTIYDKLSNNSALVKKFITYFVKENQKILSYYGDRRFNLADNKTNYFIEGAIPDLSEREKMVRILHDLNILDRNTTISKREWQCFDLYRKGKSARKTAETLNISRRTVETHFENLKNKLNTKSKSKLMEYLD
ncbi:MAG: hypothetical protein HRT87_09720 [Legionellales bacterium]|nr:hypothetical protein [Legionellales bacterium]